jgi:CheY-like chemotaxis protein
MKNDTLGRPIEILLVEDSLVHAKLAILALKDGMLKHRLTLVRDGREALEFLRQEGKFVRAPRPDLILLDLRLPQIDGMTVLETVKADPDLKRIPVVVMTASEDDQDRLSCERLDVEAFITKPVDFEKFLVLVKELKRFWHKDLILPTTEDT